MENKLKTINLKHLARLAEVSYQKVHNAFTYENPSKFKDEEKKKLIKALDASVVAFKLFLK